MHRRVALAAAMFALCLALPAQDKPVATKKPAPPEPTVKVGSIAPDFKMKDQTGKEVTLASFRGKKNVVLAFYVFAFTGG